MYLELEQDNLQELVNQNDLTIIQFSAGWCGNCRMIKPKFQAFASEFHDIPFVMVDAEQFPASRQLAKVDNLPTFAAIGKDGLIKQIQTNKADKLKNFIDEVTRN